MDCGHRIDLWTFFFFLGAYLLPQTENFSLN